MFDDEEERKKREEEARAIINSGGIGEAINTVNYANATNTRINVQNDEEQAFIDRVNEANSIINSINPRQNISAPQEPSEEDRLKSAQNAQNLVSLMDRNIEKTPIVNNDLSGKETNTKNTQAIKEELDKQIAATKTQNVTANNNKKNTSIVNKDTNVSLVSNPVENTKEITPTYQKALTEANQKNDDIKEGGLEKFEAMIDTFFDNVVGGVKQTVSGLANLVTTGAALGIRGLEGTAKIFGLEEAGNALNSAYNKVVDTGSNINETANYERTVNSLIEDDTTKTLGDVTNVISNMGASSLIGLAIPAGISGTAVQGLSVAGNSAQEVLDENEDNIGQATLTGLAKGYTSYFTERMFDANILTKGMKKTSIQNSVDKLISSKLNSKLGKEIANRTVGILGENAEELVEDNVDNLIDKLINNKDMPGFKEWWNNTTETAKVTTISTLIMSLLGMGGESFHDKEVDIEADYWIDQAQQLIEQENMAIHFNPSEVKTIDDTKDFYITRFTPEGEIANIVPTRGKTIANPNENLNVKPAIVRDNYTNLYTVIDEDTGIVLDSTPYTTTIEAESGFDEKVNKLSDLQVRDINQKVNNANYMVTNKFTRIIDQAREELSQMTPSDYGIRNTDINQNSNIEETQNKVDTLTRTINNISDKTIYSQKQTDTLLETVSNNIDNVEYVKEDNGGGILYSFDNDRNITDQQEIKGKVYSGKKIKNILNTAIQKADMTYLNTDNNTQTTNATQSSSEPNTSNFYSNETNYAVQDIKKVTEPFKKQESYSKDEMAEAWNEEISDNNYDAYYDKNGNIERYIAIEEDGNNIVVNQYDNNDNVVKSEVIPSENGRYRASDIQDTINRVASLYDENRPIKGQRDIEGNEVKSMKKKIDNKKDTKITKKIEEYIAKNPNLETNINILTDIVNDINIKEIKQMEAYKMARDLFGQVHKRKFQNNNTKTNIYVTNSDIKESINTTYTYTEQRKYLKENIAIYSQLDNIIENAELISNTNELKGRQNYQLWEYYAMPINIDNNKFIVQFDTVQREDGETHFRVERLYKITEEGGSTTVVPTKKSATRFTVEPPSTKNSISQNNQTVKTSTNPKTNKSQINTTIKSLEDIKTKYKNQTDQLNIFENKDNTISINNMVVKQNLRRKGIGQSILNDIIDYADKNGKTITLTPTSQYMTKDRLTKWYKKNGFVENKGRNTDFSISDTMYRLPKNNTQNNQNVKDDGVRAMKKNTLRNNTMQNNTTVDNQGRTLSKQQQEYFKDSKIRDNNGNLLTVYHGTDKVFTEFKNKYIQHGRAVTDGFYLTPDRTNASEYGNNIMELYANIKNPLYLHNYNGVTRELIDRGYANDTDVLIKKYNLETDNSGVVPTAKALTKLVKKLGYDGIITTTNENDIIDTDWSATQIVVFNSNQIKNITNSSPTSDKDIRYMKRNTLRSKTLQNNITVDNQGRTLTKQQQEYFKNSKVRNEQGNLQTVYHTTTNAGEQFNIFDPRNTDFYRFGDQIVNYYTDSKVMSGSYADGNYEMAETNENISNTKNVKRQYEGYINITNPYVIDAEGNNWNQVKTEINEYGKKLLNEIDVLEKNNIYNKLKQIYDDVERTSREASDRFYKIQKKAGLEQYDILGEYARWGNIDNIYENGLFNEQGKAAIANHINDTMDGKTLKEIGLDLFNNKYETLLNKEIDKLKKQYPDIKDIPLEDFDIIAEHYDEGKRYIENRYRNQETTNDIVKKVIDLNNNGANYDGIIIKNVRDYGGGEVENYTPANVYVTFNSNQFKNANNTNPTSNQDIRFAKKTAKTPKVEGEVLEPGQTNAQRESNYIEQEIRKIEESGNWDNSIPVTRMTDIRKTIEDYLGIGVQKGRFRQQAYGIYKGNRDVIRTKELKDMDTILHETGHALDIGKRIKLNKEAISDELLKAVNNYGGYEAETRQVQLEEGFAEVIREYTIIPEQARLDYPQTVAVLEGMRQEDKDFNKFITDVQQQTYDYIHQNPRNRTLSNVSIGERTDQTKLTPAKIQQEVMRNIYDKDWALKSAVNEMQKVNGKTTKDLKASENAYYLTRLSSGIGDKVVSILSKGYIDENGNKLMPGLDKLGEILGNNASRFDDLRAYLVAQRDLEYKAKTLKTGIRTMDSKAVVEQFKNDTQIQEASKLVYDTLDGVMKYAVNNGLIEQETANSLRESNAFYVPMQRVLEGNKNNVGRRGAVADIIKARTGSELDVKDVLENIVANSANIIQQVENNNILKALYKQGEQAGMTGKIYDVIDAPMVKIGTAKLSTWERELRNQGVNTTELDLEKTIDLFAPNNKVDTNNLITSFINDNGKRVYLQFNDEILFNSLMNMDKKFMSAVLNINRKLNMPLRYGATMANIGFAIPNMISDTAQAAIFSEAGFIPVVDNVIGIMDILSVQNKSARNFFNKVVPGYADRINTLYALYEQTGATSATRMSQYRERTQSLMKDVYGTKNSEVLGIKEKYKPLKRLLDIMTYIPELSEQSTRFRVFEKNLEYYRRNGMSEMDARIEAALQSRDATQDFGRTGNITREINQLIPFSAARVGSAYTFAEKIKANPKRAVSRMAILLAISTAITALGYDDDEIEELNQRKKNDNFVLKVGDQIVTIKKPQGILRSIINLGQYVQDLFTGHIEEGKEGERLVELVQSAIMDNMPADSVTGLVPNMVAPVVENAINKDLYYNSDIVKSYDLELPDSEQYYDYNSQLAIWLGQIFNYSPAKIDNLISGYFAGLGTSVTNVIDWIAGKTGIATEQPEMGAEDNAVGKRFFVNVNSNSQSVDEIYDLKTDLTKKKNGGTITEEEQQQLDTITEAISEISKLNKQIKEIKKDLTKSGEQKADEIKLLQQQKTDTARQALGKELLYSENQEKIESTKLYPSRDTLSQNNRTLTMTPEMKKEYEEVANEYYNKYARQGLYSDEKLEQIQEKAKDYAKNYMMKKYKSELIK